MDFFGEEVLPCSVGSWVIIEYKVEQPKSSNAQVYYVGKIIDVGSYPRILHCKECVGAREWRCAAMAGPLLAAWRRGSMVTTWINMFLTF